MSALRRKADPSVIVLTRAAITLLVAAALHPSILCASIDRGPDARSQPERSRWQAGAPGIDEQSAGLMIAVERAFDANDPRAALVILAKLRELRPRDPTVWNSIGYALVQVRDLPGAAEAYRKSLQVDPSYAEGAYNLALAFIDLNKLDDARRSLEPWIPRDTWISLLGRVSPTAEMQRVLEWGQTLDAALRAGGIAAAFKKAGSILDAKLAAADKVVLHVFLPSPRSTYLHLWLRARPAARELPDGFPALEDGKRFHQHQGGQRFTQDLAWAGDLPLVAAVTEREPVRHFGEPPPKQSEFVKMEAAAFVGRYDVTLETPDISEVKGLRRRLEGLLHELFPELKASQK